MIKLILKILKNIVKAYVIGNSVNFFKNKLAIRLIFISKNLKNSIIQILKDINLFHKENNFVLLSPAAASYDQFLNFEKRVKNLKN